MCQELDLHLLSSFKDTAMIKSMVWKGKHS